MKKTKKHTISRKHVVFAIISIVMFVLYVLFCPQLAYAVDSPFNFNGLIGIIQNIVTWLLLPLCIVWVSWKLLYLAVVVGIFGFDPLGYCTTAGSGNTPDYSKLTSEIKYQLSQFVKGICWVGGVFIIFQIVLIVASTIAGVFGEAFG